MRVILLSVMVIGCGLDVKVKDSSHKVEVADSNQTVTIKTTLDKILEICGVVKKDGTVIKYEDWTDEQKECFNILNQEYLNESDIDSSDYSGNVPSYGGNK